MLKSIAIVQFCFLMTAGCTSPEPQVIGPPAEEEVTFSHDDITLAGTLSLPGTDAKKHKAIILVSDSGPQDRDSEIAGFKLLRMLADTFNSLGYAVLRYDDRGHGQSTGKAVAESTSEELAEDARAAFLYLKSRSDIDVRRIGMMGHGEGGIIVPMVAAKEPDVAFAILMAGYGVTGAILANTQQGAVLRKNGVPEAFIEASGNLNIEVVQRMKEGIISPDSLRAYTKAKALKLLDLLPPEILSKIPDKEAYATSSTEQAIAQSGSPWLFFYLTYDPLPMLEKVKCPTLLLFGALDAQVLAGQNEELMVKALAKGDNKKVKTVTIPKANHLFQEAITGGPDEYMILPEQYAPGFFDEIKHWLKDLR